MQNANLAMVTCLLTNASTAQRRTSKAASASASPMASAPVRQATAYDSNRAASTRASSPSAAAIVLGCWWVRLCCWLGAGTQGPAAMSGSLSARFGMS